MTAASAVPAIVDRSLRSKAPVASRLDENTIDFDFLQALTVQEADEFRRQLLITDESTLGDAGCSQEEKADQRGELASVTLLYCICQRTAEPFALEIGDRDEPSSLNTVLARSSSPSYPLDMFTGGDQHTQEITHQSRDSLSGRSYSDVRASGGEQADSEREHLVLSNNLKASVADSPSHILQVMSFLEEATDHDVGTLHDNSVHHLAQQISSVSYSSPRVFRLQLQPNALGEISITIRRSANATKVEISASHPATVALLAGDLTLLKDSLNALPTSPSAQATAFEVEIVDPHAPQNQLASETQEPTVAGGGWGAPRGQASNGSRESDQRRGRSLSIPQKKKVHEDVLEDRRSAFGRRIV